MERRVDAQYVTLLVLLWHAHSRQFTMANAGSAPPLICRRGEILKPRVEGIPLGLLDNQDYEETVFQAETGDLVLLYSDGVQDQINGPEEEFGRWRIKRSLIEHCGRPASEIIEAILQDLDRFADGAPASDDQTLIVMRVRE
jgi:sigma-B regulation protein RsbU (phosphoserine phosphatase)